MRLVWVIYSTIFNIINTYKIYARKLEAKRPIARLRNRWEVNIRMDLSDIGCEDVDWFHVAQDTVL